MTTDELDLIATEITSALERMGKRSKVTSRKDVETFADALLRHLGHQYYVEEVTGLIRMDDGEQGYMIYMSREDVSDTIDMFVSLN